jgi:hypothetical protein
MDAFIDKAGTPLKVGDLIVYGHALGRCAGLKYGKIVDLLEDQKHTWHGTTKKVAVQGVDDHCGKAPTLCRIGRLEFSERILVITKEQLPVAVQELLK